MSEPRTPVGGYTPVLPIKFEPIPSAHAPLAGCEEVRIADHALRRHTFQSSAVKEPWSAWMYATEPEREPWWEIDLGGPMFVEQLTLWLAPVPDDVEVTIRAHVLHLPGGRVPPMCPRWDVKAGDLRVARDGTLVLQMRMDSMARYLRVSLRAPDGQISLLVRGAEILTARVFGDSLLQSYERAFTLFADRPLFSAREKAGTGPFVVTHLYRDVWIAARALAASLAERLRPAESGERLFVGMCTKNRAEWVILDLAALLLGHVVVPLSPDDSEERLAGILGRCPLRAVLVEGSGAARFSRLSAGCPSLRWIVTCEPEPPEGAQVVANRDQGASRDQTANRDQTVGGAAEIVSLDRLIAEGMGPPSESFAAARRGEKELYTLLFTSGSTGVPKGAMRSYATFQAMVESYFIAQPAVHLSFQPLSHLSERLFQPAVILSGGEIGFSGGGAHVLSDLAELQPSVVSSVPRLYEVVLAAHERRLEAARAAAPDEPPGEVEARVLAETRGVFGARVQAVATGSAPCSPEVLAFLKRCFSDLWVADGYGSTEVGTITSDGRVQAHVQVKLVPLPGVSAGEAESGPERGEIWVKSPHMIDGYFGDPAATAASLDEEGYFATGDLGERTADGGVRVVGRVKNVIKLGQGEFVAIDRIEAALVDCPLVDQIFVHPDASSSALLAVVVPRADALARALPAEAESATGTLASHPEAARVIAAALQRHGRRAGLASFEVPRAVIVEPEPFTVESGLLTASGKLARAALVARYSKRLAELGSGTGSLALGATGHLSSGDGAAEGGAESLAQQIARVASRVVGRRVSPTDPLHEGLGVDSLVVADVLSAASAALEREIPLSTWFEARTIEDLARRLDAGMLGRGTGADPRESDSLLEAKPRTGDFRSASPRVPFETILLTGATGLLGVHLLESLVARTKAHVICLVRPARGPRAGAGSEDSRAGTPDARTDHVERKRDEAAAERVRETLSRYEIPSLDPARWSAIAADLGAPDLDLSERRFAELAERADAIVHAGAEVNWLASYEALRASNVLGTLALLSLAMTARTKPFHHVSTISTALAAGDETSMLPFSQARAGSGYGLAKWVAEKIVRGAADRGHPAAVYRPAMITGHSARGLGNPEDYVHRYLRATALLGRHLESDERLDMTPVDHVADAIVALLSARPEGGATHHLVNLEQSMTYSELGRAVAKAGYPCVPARYSDFRDLVVNVPQSPLRPLQSYFPEAGFGLRMGPWPSARTRDLLATLGVTCPKVDDALIATYLSGLARIIHSLVRPPR